MSPRILVPWGLQEIAREAIRRAGAEPIFPNDGDDLAPDLHKIAEALRNAEVLLSRASIEVPDELLTANPALRGIANHGVGFDNINVSLATELGIPVTNTPGVLTETTADLAWALLMATARRIPQAHQHVVSGKWIGTRDKPFLGLDVGPGGSNRPKVLGIVGFGKIGQAVMRRSRGFEMKVLAHDLPMKQVIEQQEGVTYRELDDLLRESDFVTLHCLLSAQTHHLIGRHELELMKPTAVLINAARGPIVDEEALVAALRGGTIAAAGLDVYENEPELTAGLAELEDIVLLPHIGSGTQDTRDQMALMTVENAVAMAGFRRPMNMINPEVLQTPQFLRKVN